MTKYISLGELEREFEKELCIKKYIPNRFRIEDIDIIIQKASSECNVSKDEVLSKILSTIEGKIRRISETATRVEIYDVLDIVSRSWFFELYIHNPSHIHGVEVIQVRPEADIFSDIEWCFKKLILPRVVVIQRYGYINGIVAIEFDIDNEIIPKFKKYLKPVYLESDGFIYYGRTRRERIRLYRNHMSYRRLVQLGGKGIGIIYHRPVIGRPYLLAVFPYKKTDLLEKSIR